MDFDLQGTATLYTDSLSYREGGGMHRSTRPLRHYTRAQMAVRLYVKDLGRVDIFVDAVRAKAAKGREGLFLGVCLVYQYQWIIMFQDSQQWLRKTETLPFVFEHHMRSVRLEL
jgi:hypothetical protein